MRDVVALLPMKGHSERVPGKNLRPLAGKPLYHWIMEALLGVESIGVVVVDTDSEEIAEDVGRNYPLAEVRERPADLVGDDVPMHDIVARFVAEHQGEHFLQTHATNPLMTVTTIESAIEAYRAERDRGSLMSVTEWRTRLYDSHGRPMNHDPDVLLRTQDLPPVYEENSNLYIASREVILETGRRFGPEPILYPLDRLDSIDIDVEIDFVVAECLLRWRQR